MLLYILVAGVLGLLYLLPAILRLSLPKQKNAHSTGLFMECDEHELRNINSNSEIKEAAELCTSAFVDAASYNFIFSNIQNLAVRSTALRWMFTKAIQINWGMNRHIPLAAFSTRNSSPAMDCFFMLVPPNTSSDMRTLIAHGLLEMPWRYGFGAVGRMLGYMQHFDDVYAQQFDQKYGRERFMLERMVVAPDKQHQGIGSRCLRAALETVVQPTGLPCVLATQKESNVKFYKRLGFELVHQYEMFDSPQYLMAWQPPTKDEAKAWK